MNRLILLCWTLCAVGCLPTGPAEISISASPLQIQSRIASSDPLRVGTSFPIFDQQPAELVWVTGCELDITDDRTGESHPELLAASTVDFRYPDWHREQYKTNQGGRLFSLGSGSAGYHLPAGFGIPVHSNEQFWWSARVMNPDPYFPATTVTPRCSLFVTRQRGLKASTVPLLCRDFSVRRHNKGAWPIPPGGATVSTEITSRLGFKHRTSVHGVTVSLNDWADHFELWDITTKERLLHLQAVTDPQTGRVLKVEQYSDSKGFLLDPAHRYEARARYGNPKSTPTTGYAYVTLYAYDPDYQVRQNR